MLNNSKCVVNICCYAPRRMYTHNAHPCFEWYIPSKSPILQDLLNVESENIFFGRFKGMNLQSYGVRRMVHHKLMYERGSWMGLNAWTFFMPSGINNCLCTQSHSWTPNSCTQSHSWTPNLVKLIVLWVISMRVTMILEFHASKNWYKFLKSWSPMTTKLDFYNVDATCEPLTRWVGGA